MSRSLAGGTVAFAALLMSFAASAETLTITGLNHFLDNRSSNSIGLTPGLLQQFGATSVVPVGANPAVPATGTTGVATQGTATVPLNHFPFDLSPNFFAAARLANNVPNGGWTLTFTNGGDTTTAPAPTPGIGGATQIGFATGMSTTPGNAPTFNWNRPTGTIDTQHVRIYDLTDFRGTGGVGGNGVANFLFSSDIGATATSFTIDPTSPLYTQLVFGRQYAFELELRDLRAGATGTGLPATLSQSRSFIDFMLLPNDAPAKVYLPFTDATNPAAPVYKFNSVPVMAGQAIFIDPLVAIGYDYQTGLGDPNFMSVTLPTGIGDNLYALWLWDGEKYVFSKNLTGGVAHLFDGLGVDRFRILGIELAALLDPLNSMAFITGLTFLSDGSFNGTMTAITAEVPLPAALPLFATILAGGGLIAWRRKRKAAALVN